MHNIGHGFKLEFEHGMFFFCCQLFFVLIHVTIELLIYYWLMYIKAHFDEIFLTLFDKKVGLKQSTLSFKIILLYFSCCKSKLAKCRTKTVQNTQVGIRMWNIDVTSFRYVINDITLHTGCDNPQYYGSNCSLRCPDVNYDSCNIQTGRCQECKPGYQGNKCEQL